MHMVKRQDVSSQTVKYLSIPSMETIPRRQGAYDCIKYAARKDLLVLASLQMEHQSTVAGNERHALRRPHRFEALSALDIEDT